MSGKSAYLHTESSKKERKSYFILQGLQEIHYALSAILSVLREEWIEPFASLF